MTCEDCRERTVTVFPSPLCRTHAIEFWTVVVREGAALARRRRLMTVETNDDRRVCSRCGLDVLPVAFQTALRRRWRCPTCRRLFPIREAA